MRADRDTGMQARPGPLLWQSRWRRHETCVEGDRSTMSTMTTAQRRGLSDDVGAVFVWQRRQGGDGGGGVSVVVTRRGAVAAMVAAATAAAVTGRDVGSWSASSMVARRIRSERGRADRF